MHTVYKTVKKILDESEFVGDRFADEARSIHRGDAPDRLITGTSDLGRGFRTPG